MARPRKFDESAVITAARDEFWTRGYGATSVDYLTAATGLGKGSLYGAFGDKHALYLRIFDDYIAGAVQSVHDDLAGDDAGALGRIRAHLLSVLVGLPFMVAALALDLRWMFAIAGTLTSTTRLAVRR